MIEIEPEIVELSNGIRLVYLHRESPVGHFGITAKAGSRYETPEEEGLAHFLEHCLFKGTKKRKSYHVLSRLDAVGGELNAYTTKEEVCIYGSFTNPYLHRAVELIGDIVSNPVFPEKEIEKEKIVVLDEINSYLDSPSDRIFDDFESLLFPNHPLGANILGRVETVSSFNKEMLLDYMHRFFTTRNVVVSYVGNARINQLVKWIEKYVILRQSGEVQDAKPFEQQKVFKVKSPEANYQAHILLGSYAPSYHDEDRRVMSLLMNMLGGPALNAQLIMSIREKYGYAYNIEANYSAYNDGGYWSVYLGCDQRHLKKAYSLTVRELQKVVNHSITPAKLERFKEQYKGQLVLGMDSNSGLMLGLGKSLLFYNEIDKIADIYESIESISTADIKACAEKYLAENQISSLIFEVVKQ